MLNAQDNRHSQRGIANSFLVKQRYRSAVQHGDYEQDSEASPPGLTPGSTILKPERSWASYLNSPRLSFLIYKMGIIKAPYRVVLRLKWLYSRKRLKAVPDTQEIHIPVS